ncbi:MAG: translation initiation factor IF-2 [Planctomycetota bacterium]
MTKKRVFELAKEYGLKGTDLAKKLKELGFEQVRNQMSALDDFELLQVQARLELAGMIPESKAPSETMSSKPLGMRRTPRKPVVETPVKTKRTEPPAQSTQLHSTQIHRAPAEPASTHPALEHAAEAHAHTTETVEAPAHRHVDTKHAVEDHTHPTSALRHDSAHTAPAVDHPISEAHESGAHAKHGGVHTVESEIEEAQREVVSQAMDSDGGADSASVLDTDVPNLETELISTEEPVETTEFVDSEVSADVEGAVETAADAAPDATAATADSASETGPSTKAPSPRMQPVGRHHGEPRPTRQAGRPAAKIVGRIDPALLKPQKPATPPKSTSAPHEKPKQATAEGGISVSGSDADVRPTLKHNRSRALTRSDVSQSRDRLTAAQLREKEQGRVRRLTGPQKGGLGTMTNRFGAPGTPGSAAAEKGSGRGATHSPERRSQIIVTPPITIRGLSEALGLKINDLMKTLLMQFQRMGVNPNTTLSEEDAKLLSLEHGFEIEVRAAVTAEEEIRADRKKIDAEDSGQLIFRAPVIAFLGHVDHGKTSLIDAIREKNVAGGEAGGITQHIGAYRVTTKSGHPITILDTPGHEAFTEMRKRGAQATDIVILVVAGDDGVMPQTEEAYSHAKAAGVPVIVALNKSDKATEQQKEKTISQLATMGLAPEMWRDVNWGGHTAIIETSATKKTGISELLERVALEAEVLDLKANPNRNPEGIVIEAQKSGQRGIVATLLVQKGTLRPGDIILAGAGYGRVRNVYDDRGRALDEAGPSMPIEVTGLSELPAAGDRFVIVDELNKASEAAGDRARKLRERERASQSRENVNLASLFSRIKESQQKEIRIVLKADVGGSLEVLKKQLDSLGAKDPHGNEIHVKVIHAQVGAITEADVNLAATSAGMVVGFNVIASDSVKKLGMRDDVEVRVYHVLYELLEDVKKAMHGLVAPIQREAVTGHAEVRATFRSSKFGTIAGCMVSDGFINRSSSLRVVRNGVVVYTGKLDSLRRVKEDVREVKAGFECGIKVAGYDDVKDGDVLEAFEIKEEKAMLTPV